MIPRLFIAPLLATILLAPIASLSAADSQPNIVFIVSDDQGAGDYGFMGHPHVQTPHLDKLAAQSLMFPRGFVPTSVCCPSLATIITGLYPHQHKVTANDPPLPPGAKAKGGRGSTPELTARWNGMLDNIPTLPRLLASKGYVSFQTGKWWQGDFTRGGFTHGMSKGSRHGDEGLTIGREGLQPIYDFIADSRQQQKPFFVWYAPLMPHTPHTPPERLFRKYAAKTDSPHVARYWAMCEWFDESCGELLDHLEKENLSENTIVVYVTDNGWIQSTTTAGFAPKSKTSPFDAGHRTPILVRWPGHVTPAKSGAMASSIDLVPTVLAAIELPAPEGLRGVNLLDTGAVESRQQVFGEDFTIRSQTLDDVNANVLWRWVTDGRWRLILPRTFEAEGSLRTIPQDNYLKPYLITTLQAAQPMLYDLESDPKEEINVAGDYPEIVSALRIKLDAHWKPQPSPESTAAISGTPPGFSPEEIAFRQVDLENTSETSANISIGDLDGDGDLDIVLAKGRHWPLHNRILINDGAGEFQVNRNLGDLPDRSYTTALADVDGDGDLDILVSNDKPDEKRVYRNDGKGNFAPAGTWGKPSWNTRNISIADLNGDRFPDLIVANRKSQSYIILNDGQGNFPDKKWTAIPSESASTIVTADFNGDGLTDLAIPQRDGGVSQVLFNDSEFLFQRATTFGPASSSARACAAGDLNADGAMDLIVGDDRLGTRLCLNDGRGNFPTMMEVGDSKLIPCSIAVSDMNADQRLDIVVGYSNGGSSVFLNHGKATKFDAVPFGDAKGAVYGIAIGDVNGDGRNDIAQARSEAPNVLFLSEQPRKK